MVLLSDAIQEKRLDSRLLERNILRGVVTQQEADAVSKALPDDASNGDFRDLESIKNETGKAAPASATISNHL